MLIAIHGVKLNAHYYTWSEALCSRLIKKRSTMLFVIHGVALCSFLYME